MEYKYWVYREGLILVEKYSGAVSKHDIINNDKHNFEQVDIDSLPLKCLTDISNASLEDISFGEIIELFKPIESNSQKTTGMKLALYNGANSIEDFLKASSYSKYEHTYNLSIKCFVTVQDAMDWLEMTTTEQKDVIARFGMNVDTEK